MGPEELKMWKKRLDHSHSEWRAAGWIPDTKGGTATDYRIMKYLDAYRGDFPEALAGGTEASDQMVGNIFFSIVNTMVTQNSGRTPDPILRPLGGTAAGRDARRRAWINEQLIRSMMREKKFKREVDASILSAVLTGAGFMRHGFTPEIEWEDDQGRLIPRFKNHTPDMPWIQMLRPWQIRIDPMVNCFAPDSEPRWCAFQGLWFADQIKRNPNMTFRRDLIPTYHQDLRAERDRRPNGTYQQPTEDETVSMYEEWTVYDFEERKFFGVTEGSDSLIREEKDWVVDYGGQLPYSYLAFNMQIDSPFPIPYPQMFYREQLLYNKIWTILNAMVSRTRRILGVNGNAIDPDQLSMLTNPDSLVESIIFQTNPSEAIADMGFGSFDGQLLGLLFQLKEQIREVLGVSSFDRGQRANVETANEAQQIGDGAAIARGRNQEKVEEFWANIIRVAHRSFLQNDRAREQAIPIIGQENLNFLEESDRAQGFLKTTIGDLQGEFDYAIRANSTMKIDPAQQLAAKISVYNTLGGQQSQLLNQRYYHESIVEESGDDPRQAVISEEVLAAQQAQQQDQDGDGQPDGGVASTAQQGLPDIQSIRGGAAA